MSSKTHPVGVLFEHISGADQWQTAVFTNQHRRTQAVQDSANANGVRLENQLTERFGLLMSHTQLAELLGRSASGLRYSLSYPSDASTRALKSCGRKVGRRVYYPASEVARIILGSGEA
jgi:hypothetical protein